MIGRLRDGGFADAGRFAFDRRTGGGLGFC